MHNSVNGIRTVGDECVKVVVVPVNVRTLRVDEDLFRVSIPIGISPANTVLTPCQSERLES